MMNHSHRAGEFGLSIWWSKWALNLIVVTSTLKSDTEHSQLLGIVNCTDYGTPQRISYIIKFRQQTTTNVQKVVQEVPKMLEGNKMCDTTLELIFNGVLPHKCDAPYNNNYSKYYYLPFLNIWNGHNYLGLCHWRSTSQICTGSSYAPFFRML